MNTSQHTLSALTLSVAALLAACDQSKPPAVDESAGSGVNSTQNAVNEAQRETQAAGTELKEDASRAGEAIADSAADMTITTKVKTALAGDAQLSALAIDVDTRNKVVTLTGPAPTAAAADRATSLAQAVDGVAEVKNMLIVAGQS